MLLGKTKLVKLDKKIGSNSVDKRKMKATPVNQIKNNKKINEGCKKVKDHNLTKKNILKRQPLILTHTKKIKLKLQPPPTQYKLPKQFQEIMQIYNKSHQITAVEEIDLMCMDEDLEDTRQRRRSAFQRPCNYYKKSQKSISQLPSIQERAGSQSDPEFKQIEATQDRKKERECSILKTTASARLKNTRSVNQNYTTQFELKIRGHSNQKKIAIDVQNLLKGRLKIKSSLSNQSGRYKEK